MKSNSVKLGNPIFNQLLFVLHGQITQRNHLDYRFMNYKLRNVAPGIWVMPADVTPRYGFFLVFTRIETGSTVIAISAGHFDRQRHDFKLKRPVVTGRGLNELNRHNPGRALRLAHFLNQISRAAEGDWRMVKN